MKSLPKDLGAIYDQILQRIDEREMSSAKVILQWLILGKRPLETKELAIVLTFDQPSGSFDSRLQLPQIDDIIQLCSSLVIKTYGDTVQLAHASVKEYFLCNTWKIGLPDVTFVRQLRNSRLQRYRRFLKGVPALNDKRSIRGSYRLIRQAGLNDNEID